MASTSVVCKKELQKSSLGSESFLALASSHLDLLVTLLLLLLLQSSHAGLLAALVPGPVGLHARTRTLRQPRLNGWIPPFREELPDGPAAAAAAAVQGPALILC